MSQVKKKNKKKPVKARQQVKLTGKALAKFTKQNTSKLPDRFILDAYEE